MTLTHAQLLDAVRAAGRDRESFTCADVRQQLGLSSGDRKLMNRFYKLFGALQKDDANQVEKLGSNCYRLRVTAAAPSADAPSAAPPEPVLEAAVQTVAQAVAQASGAVEASLCVSEALHVTPAPVSSTPASKPRAQWIGWIANFFSRRAAKSDVTSGVPVGA